MPDERERDAGVGRPSVCRWLGYLHGAKCRGRITWAGGSPIDRVSRKIQPPHQRRQDQGRPLMASDGIACRIFIQNEQLQQVDTFPYLGSLITEDGEYTTELRTRLNMGQAIGASLQKLWKSHSIPISKKLRLMKVLVCRHVATYGCESWTLRKKSKN